ncbi:MAG: MoaD/ThiS family protein [Pseudomonadota bacterium]
MIVVDDKPMEWLPGMTVSQVLAALEHTQLCAAIRLDGKLVSSPNFDTTQVPDNAVIRLLPLIAGG